MRETWLYNEPVLNPLLPKAVIANCLCAVSQGSLSCADCTFCYPGNPLFMSLKADHLVLGTAEHLCAKMSYCRKERNYGGKGERQGWRVKSSRHALQLQVWEKTLSSCVLCCCRKCLSPPSIMWTAYQTQQILTSASLKLWLTAHLTEVWLDLLIILHGLRPIGCLHLAKIPLKQVKLPCRDRTSVLVRK